MIRPGSCRCLPAPVVSSVRGAQRPQSERDWITSMFADGLDVSSHEAVIENLHLPNYPSAAENAPLSEMISIRK